MTRFYVGDGISGIRHWLFARLIYDAVPWRVAKHLDPGLPDGWQWNVHKSGRGLYARHDS